MTKRKKKVEEIESNIDFLIRDMGYALKGIIYVAGLSLLGIMGVWLKERYIEVLYVVGVVVLSLVVGAYEDMEE